MAFHDPGHSGTTSNSLSPPLTLAWTWTDPLTYDTVTFPPGTGYFWLPVYYRGHLYVQGGNNANRLFELSPSGSLICYWNNPDDAQNGTSKFQFQNYPAASAGYIVTESSDFSIPVTTDGTCSSTTGISNTYGGYPTGAVGSWNDTLAYAEFYESDTNPQTSNNFYMYPQPNNITTSTAIPPLGSTYLPNNSTTFADSGFIVPAAYSLSGNPVAISPVEGQIWAFNIATGADAWSGPLGSNQYYGVSPAINGTTMYVFNAGGGLDHLESWNISGTTPSQNWSVFTARLDSIIVSNGMIYGGGVNTTTFYAINASNGSTAWTLTTSSAWTPYQIPAISGNVIYVPSPDGNLFALNATTGAQIWEYTGSGGAFGPVIIAGGYLFTSDYNLTLYAFQ